MSGKFSLSKSEVSLSLVHLDSSIYNVFAYLCLCISIVPLLSSVLFFCKLSPSNYLSHSILFTIFSPDLGYLIHNCILTSFLGCQFLFSLYIYPSLPDCFSVLLRNTRQRLFRFTKFLVWAH